MCWKSMEKSIKNKLIFFHRIGNIDNAKFSYTFKFRNNTYYLHYIELIHEYLLLVLDSNDNTSSNYFQKIYAIYECDKLRKIVKCDNVFKMMLRDINLIVLE